MTLLTSYQENENNSWVRVAIRTHGWPIPECAGRVYHQNMQHVERRWMMLVRRCLAIKHEVKRAVAQASWAQTCTRHVTARNHIQQTATEHRLQTLIWKELLGLMLYHLLQHSSGQVRQWYIINIGLFVSDLYKVLQSPPLPTAKTPQQLSQGSAWLQLLLSWVF